jgi:arylsulfatase A-like enzyme
MPWAGQRMIRTALAALAVAVLVVALGPRPAAANDRPNILVIMTDDQRAGTMDVMPKTRQWFETGGTQFNHAFATTPVCCPSRASVFSGRYTHNHRVATNDSAALFDPRYAIQGYLKAAGYKTGMFGKYFNAWNVFQSPPWFDDWAIFSAGYSPIRVNEQGVVKTVNEYATSYIRDNAVRFIEESESQDATPWLLNLWTTAPHAPFTPDTQYQDASVPPYEPSPSVFESDRSDKPPYVQARAFDLEPIEQDRANQLRTLMSVDDMVQTVFEALDANGETADTLAFFLSDNGYLWADHGLQAKGYSYDKSVRVPMYMRWPGRVVAGATDNRLVANIDVAPTIADAVTGIAPAVPMDGRSLLDPLQNRTRLLTEYEGFHWAGLRTLTSHYVEHYDAFEHTIVHREYYDLMADPFELENLLADGNAANDPPTAALSAQLAADKECVGFSCP